MVLYVGMTSIDEKAQPPWEDVWGPLHSRREKPPYRILIYNEIGGPGPHSPVSGSCKAFRSSLGEEPHRPIGCDGWSSERTEPCSDLVHFKSHFSKV